MIATIATLAVTDLNMAVIAKTPCIAEYTGTAGKKKGRQQQASY